MAMLDNRVAIVTGGASGIGARTAELFVAQGAKVVIAARRAEEGNALAERLGRAASFMRTDVTQEVEVARLVEHALETFGRLDCLVNNAGNPGRMMSTAEFDMTHFDAVLAVHLHGAMLGMKYAARPMLQQGSGSIINIASVSGLRAGFSSHSYSAAKAGLIHLTRSVAVELGEKGIRVNSISPGPILTGIFAKGAGTDAAFADRAMNETEAALRAIVAQWQPIPRLGLPDDIAQTALFLASDASSLMNGHNLVVDGGIAAGRTWATALADRATLARAAQASM